MNTPKASGRRVLILGGTGEARALAAALVDAGIDAWEMGTIGALTDDAADAGLDFVQGAKGVDGGAAILLD